MQPSIFNVRVPIDGRDDVFLMNTLTDAQLIVSSDVAALLDRQGFDDLDGTERDAYVSAHLKPRKSGLTSS
jgi:hypothetical protein